MRFLLAEPYPARKISFKSGGGATQLIVDLVRSEIGLPCSFVISQQLEDAAIVHVQVKNAAPSIRGQAFRRTPAMAKAVRCDASRRAVTASGVLRPMDASPCAHCPTRTPSQIVLSRTASFDLSRAGQCRRRPRPKFPFAESASSSSLNGIDRFVVHFVGVEPLRHDPAGLEVFGGQLIKFPRIDAGHADHPRIRRLRNDDVQVLLRAEFQRGAGVFVIKCARLLVRTPLFQGSNSFAARRTGSQFSATVK